MYKRQLQYAIEQDKFTLFVKLVERGARLFQTDQEGNNAMHWIALQHRIKMMTHLLSILNWDSLVALAKTQNNYRVLESEVIQKSCHTIWNHFLVSVFRVAIALRSQELLEEGDHRGPGDHPQADTECSG